MKTPRGHPLTMEYYKGSTGEYIGKVVEIPEIVVHAKTKQKLIPLIIEAVGVYFEAFPDQKAKVYAKNDETQLEKIVINC